MTSLFVVTILLISHLALTLHSQTHHQLAPKYNEDSYLKELALRQAKLNDSMNKIKAQIDNLNKKLKTGNLTPNQQITTLQEGLAEERDALYNVETYMKLPFNLQPCSSSRLTPEQRDSLRKQSNQLNASLQTLKTQLVSCVKCTITAQIGQSILRQENYLKVIGQILDSNCGKVPKQPAAQSATGLVDLSQSIYKNNLLASNWVFGNLTQQQYRLEVFAASIKYNLTSCPVEKPFVNPTANDCFNCPTGLKYNLGTKICETCPEGTKFSFAFYNCISICGTNQRYDTLTKQCVVIPDKPQGTSYSLCPVDKPVWNSINKVCEPCPAATPIYDQNKKACINCQVNTVWNADVKQCLPACAANNVYNINLQKCVPQLQCDAAKPFLNPLSQACQACPAATKWSINTKKCEILCGQGTVYNSKTKQCDKIQDQKCNDMKPIWNSTSLLCQICPQQTPVWQKQTKTCLPCPAITPVYDYSQFICVQKICDVGKKWNRNLLRCSPESKNCSKQQIYIFANETCVDKCQANHTYYPINDTCACPLIKPEFNKLTRKCEEPQCQVGNKWNQYLLKCSPIDKPCNAWELYYFTFERCEIKCEVNQTYIKDSNTCTCPAVRPVFNATSKTCSQPICPILNQWNVNLLKCSPIKQQCLAWQEYNFTDQLCYTMCEVNHTYFRVNNTCSCTPEIPFFDNKTRTCVVPVCVSGSTWNKYLLRCSLIDMQCASHQSFNFTIEKCVDECEVNITYDKQSKRCLCPIQKPLFDTVTKKCLEPFCPDGFKWNVPLIKCSPINKNCTKWQKHNFTTEECVNKCEVNQTYYSQNNTCTCPPERPLYDKVVLLACIEPPCNNGSKWNKFKLKCSLQSQPCPAHQQYNFTLEECINQCQVNHIYYKNNDTCSCTPDAPLFQPKTRKCIIPPCDEKSKWNINLKKCSPLTKNCSLWQLYNFLTEQCDKKCQVNQAYLIETDTCQCTPEYPIYNKLTKVCQEPPCQGGHTLWNKYLLKCSPVKQTCHIQQYYDFATELCVQRCQVNHTYFQQNDSCSCLPEKPYFNSTSRICQEPQCQAGKLWNAYLRKCSPILGNCLPWQIYNFTDQTCINKCDPNQIYYKDNDTCSCTPLTPVFNRVTRKCVQPVCPPGQIWNKTLILCAAPWTPPTCVDPSAYYELKAGACICKAGFQYYEIYKSCKPLCKIGEYLDTITMQCQGIKVVPTCAPNMYVTATGQCVCLLGYIPREIGAGCRFNCSKGYRFNLPSNSCQIINCQNGYFFNKTSTNCQLIVITCPDGTHLNKHKGSCEQCRKGYVYNTVTNLCEVKLSQLCPKDYLFNHITKLCEPPVNKCTSGLYYDSVSQTCMPLFITSPQAANLIVANMTTYTQTYVKSKGSNPKLQDCIFPTTFYDIKNNVCIQCNGKQQYFNIDANACQDCGSGAYNTTTFSCAANPTGNYNFDPTIGRFVMNLF